MSGMKRNITIAVLTGLLLLPIALDLGVVIRDVKGWKNILPRVIVVQVDRR